MTQFLVFLTTLANLVGLAVSLCLGFYIVTRTLRSRLSWLTALTLWALAGFYLHNAIAIRVPESAALYGLRPAAMLALPLAFHLILLLPPGKERLGLDFYLPPLRLPDGLRRLLGPIALPASRAVVPQAYGLALALTIGGVFPVGIPPQDATDPVIMLSDQTSGPLHPLVIVYLLLLGALAFLHLWQGWQQAATRQQRRQYVPLFVAVTLTCLGGTYLGLGISLGLAIPNFPGDLAVGVAAVLVGYTVAQHNAQVEGIDIKRDLLYIGLVIGSFTVFYVAMAQILYLGGHIFSSLTLILIIIVAISSLMLYDGLRTMVDRLFYREQFRQLRANLRALAQEAGIGQALPERLQAILGALVHTLHIKRGFIALRQDDAFVCQASVGTPPADQTLTAMTLSASEIVGLPHADADNLADMALLVPIYDGDDQIGALVLGPKEAGALYSEGDLMLLDELADQIATVIQATQLQEENAQIINHMVAEFREREHDLQRQVQQMLAERREKDRPVLEGIGEKEFASLVEDTLRHLHDFSYLGEHPLAQLQVVTRRLLDRGEEFVTHIDRGKAFSVVLLQALTKLRPEGPEPKSQQVPPREWYQFLILHAAYVQGELNRDIMSRLYISEGTFNRTRRRAIRSVAKALQEMERETHH